ncbi:hypothetical protein [Methylococcus geothermalis]|uniref:Uncharacterized protein n=1 Tax=Methylococcus geothermalis TaxID=2681310 RepID=A0A858Q9P9_9GAMM|nr:hypothetical protein [Methylococcus geothermalis]QJD30570.1 hypothetical protein GNH96_11670 [Methylococcus geothermalis]
MPVVTPAVVGGFRGGVAHHPGFGLSRQVLRGRVGRFSRKAFSVILREARLQTPYRLDLRISAASSKPLALLGIAHRPDQVAGSRIGFVPHRFLIDSSRSELSPLDIASAAAFFDLWTIT